MPSTKNPLTAKWKTAFTDNWFHSFFQAEDYLGLTKSQGGDQDDAYQDPDMEEPSSTPITKHMVGPYLILPTMSDDSDASVEVLSVVGFAPEKEIDVNMGNPSCGALVFVEISGFEGPRGALLLCSCDGVSWLTVLK